MRENNDLGIFDFDDFAMEMTSTEVLLVNGGACGGGFSGSSGGYSGGYSGSYSSGSSSASSSCGGDSGSSSGSSSSSVSSSCGGSSSSYSSGNSSASSSCGGASGSSSGSSSSVSSSCGGSSSSYSGGSSSVSSSCGGSFNGGSGTSVSSGNCGGGFSNPTTGAWGQLTNEDAIKQKMQDYENNDRIDDSMNGEGNEFSKVGCKMEGAAKILSEITDRKIDITDVNSMYDSNEDGLMTQEEISNAVKANLIDGQTFTYDYFEKTLTKSTLDSISQQYGVTYVLGRAENVHGGQHWIVLEGYSINSNGQVQFDYNGTSKNDVGRNYILGTPTDEQKNQNFYSISKIETYTIK